MTAPAIDAACLALALLDLGARAWRIALLLRVLGWRVTGCVAFGFNVLGDAASALTPLRIAGEPARFAALRRAGVPGGAALSAMGAEALLQYPILAAVGAGLVWRYGAAWRASAGRRLLHSVTGYVPWMLGLLLVVLVAARLWRARQPDAAARPRWTERLRELRPREHLPAVGLAALLTLVSVGCRVAILPLLLTAVPAAPAPGVATLASFGLLYSQLVLPTPSGAGAVDAGLRGGAAGDLGRAATPILLRWRAFTTWLPIVAGALWVLSRFVRARRAGRRTAGAGAT